MVDNQIRDVSDTALWVAAYRAVESARPDAAFHDPLAEILVGERGHALRHATQGSEFMQWAMVLRTVAIDRLIEGAVARGADTVINIGAGLDTRPYRLNLPAGLRWIEIDLPNIIELKNSRLAAHTPRCILERIACDITGQAQRQQLLAQITAQSRAVVVLTEGLLPYLDAKHVASLADDLRNIAVVKFWVQDFYSGQLLNSSLRPWRKQLKAAPFKFVVPDWIAFFTTRQWQVVERIRIADEAKRLKRRPPFRWWQLLMFMLMPPHIRKRRQDSAGYVMFEPAH